MSLFYAGSSPPDMTPPCAHCFVHYPDLALLFGVLVWYWLMTFERYNKKLKGMVGNNNYPTASLANALLRDAAACYHDWKHKHSRLVSSTVTKLVGKQSLWVMPSNLATKLLMLGICDCCSHARLRVSCASYQRAIIGGIKVRYFGMVTALVLARARHWHGHGIGISMDTALAWA